MAETKTSANSWRPSLKRILEKAKTLGPAYRLAIVGIGNELNGDDATGVLIAHKAVSYLKANPSIKVFEAGQALENITGALIRFKPDAILFIDALSIGKRPGSIHMLDWNLSEGFSASTHSLPLGMVIQYLQHEHPCQVYLLGVQVRDTSFGAELSDEVSTSMDLINNFFKKVL